MKWFIAAIFLYQGQLVQQQAIFPPTTYAPAYMGPFATLAACEAQMARSAPPSRGGKVNDLPGVDEIRLACTKIGEQ